MKRWRTNTARLALAVGLVAWLLSVFGTQIHQVTTQHEVCDEHGDLVDVGHQTPEQQTSEQAPEEQDDHDHCELDPAVLQGVATADAPSVTNCSVKPAYRLLAASTAPRGPPLRWAPKTSPPALV